MRKNLKRQLFTFLLCLFVLFTVMLSFDAWQKHYVEASSKQAQKADFKANTPDEHSLAQTQPTNITVNPISSGQEEALLPAPENPSSKEQLISESTLSNYEVTATYLNVRTEADPTSKILNVVTTGSILEVIDTTENGWLKLKAGGYVLGKYARLINSKDKQSEQVKILSAEDASREIVEKSGQVPKKPTSSITSDSGLTEKHIAQLFEGTALSGHELEKAVLDIEKEYGINAYFTIAVMKLESGNGKSQLAKNKNNLFGLNAIDYHTYNNALAFNSQEESVRKFGQIISTYYLDKGYTTVEKVARKYCEANPQWPDLVKSIMNSDYDKLS